MKINNTCYDLNSGYDCSATVYSKPAARLLKAWSTKSLTRELGKDETFSIDSIGQQELIYDYCTVVKGDCLEINLNPIDANYVYVSKNVNIASVDELGKLTANSVGRTAIDIINNDNGAKKSFMLFVLPTSELYDKILGKVNSYIDLLHNEGYPVTQSTFWSVYELAIRINENILSDEEINVLVDNGIFDYLSNAQYSKFVASLKEYNTVNLDLLRLDENTSCECENNEQYIRKYIAKCSFDGNLHESCDAINIGDEYELHHKNGDILFGWVNYGGVRVQAMREFSASNQAMYYMKAIQTGDRIYFVNNSLMYDSVYITVDGTEIGLTLEEDGGIKISDFIDAVGEEFYNTLVDYYDTDTNGYYISRGTGNNGFFFIKEDIGYPTNTLFDFECENIVSDGSTTLEPKVTVNYSGGTVTFYYKGVDESEWSIESPKEAGNYIVRGIVSPKNGYRKKICDKEVKIIDNKAPSEADKLTPPSNITLIQNGSIIDINWNNVIAASRYKILKRYNSADEWVTIGYSGINGFKDKIEECNQYIEYAVYSTNLYDTSELSEPVTIISENHKWDEGIITKNPTCTKKGEKTFVCSVCKETRKEEISVKEHSYKREISKANINTNGEVVNICTVCNKKTSESIIYYPETIILSKKSYTYNGKVQKPTVVVKDSKGKIIDKENYSISYSSGCKNVGEYKVIVKFQGNYEGKKTLTFKIKPKKASLKGVVANSKGFTVKWTKQKKQITGYEIQYSKYKNFKKATIKNINKSSTVSLKVSKLNAKKKYYVRIRTYKTIKVNGKKIKIYSDWSKAKTIRTKK